MFKNNWNIIENAKVWHKFNLQKGWNYKWLYISNRKRHKNPGLLMAKKISSILEQNIEEVFIQL